MSIWEILLLGVALSMDAVAVGMTNGMTEPKMRILKVLLIAGTYALFQFLMPVLGYYFGSVFTVFVEKIAPYLSFALLALIGGKMIFDSVREIVAARRKAAAADDIAEIAVTENADEADATSEAKAEDVSAAAPSEKPKKKLGAGKLFLQAIATSIDALAVGVTLLAAETAKGLPVHAVLCALIIGACTFTLSLAAVMLGKKAGDKFSDKAGILGGIILIAVGLKILIEAFL